ncbi:VOC family protein [Lysobacter sp. CA196]|uniref:VOC family protein n=1 Tax=Lysobacter sp. CA196 TaxID=3455606 RepID=UPI003F8D4599
MLDHLGLSAADHLRSRDFYLRVLAPLGYGLVTTIGKEITGGDEVFGFGPPQRPGFWISKGSKPSGDTHVAFSAGSRAQVDAFYAEALAAGATDNGAPGVRAHYHPNYYGAYVIDPDGNNVEAVCHAPAA